MCACAHPPKDNMTLIELVLLKLGEKCVHDVRLKSRCETTAKNSSIRISITHREMGGGSPKQD